MQNKEWIKQNVLKKETVGRSVPFNFTFSPRIRNILEAHFGTKYLEEQLNFPIRMNAPKTKKPLYADPKIFGERITDDFGVIWNTSEIDRGAPLVHPLKEASLSGYTFPDPKKKERFKGLPEWCKKNQEHFIILWVGDLFERASFMRGMEGLLLDVALDESFVAELLEELKNYIMGTMETLFDTCEFDCIALSDDYGSQNSLLISPVSWKKLVQPRLKEIYLFAKKNKKTVFHHTCGNVREIIPGLIDIGLDILHPIQPEAMDIYEIKREFGKDLALCGGIRTQDLLPKGTPVEIREEVKKLKEIMGKNGGYILEPGITLQADIPLENLLAMLEEARKS